MTEFFEFLKTRIATARRYAPAARDYALFRTLYRAGLRADESALRRACATHNYERVWTRSRSSSCSAIGTVGSTMRYVRPSATFIEDVYRRAVTLTISELTAVEAPV